MTAQTCEVSWFSALCDDDYEFLGRPDPALASSWEHCRNIVLTAEKGGFDNILLPSGYQLGLDTTAFAAAIAVLTNRIRLLMAVRTGESWPPQLARQIATLDRITGGRMTVNMISSDLPGEKLASASRYARTLEVMQILRALLNGEKLSHDGEHYQIDIDPPRMFAWGLSARDVSNAIAAQNVILPTGTTKMGSNEYPVITNSSPEVVSEIGNLPIKQVRGTTVYIRDVANVRDGASPQTNMVHVAGKRSVLLTILKNGNVSTLDIAAGVKEMMPKTLARLPKDLRATLLFDQSLFVRAAVEGVVKEAAIAAGLTAIMILIFLGSWRSTLIVVISIPLSILVSIMILAAMGHTLNVMTLGGMSLAVGILVDDATVEVENIHRNMHGDITLAQAILTGAAQIATPAFVATICICIVFVPVAFITGAAK